jgi:lysophospholipid acyltransferase (LPLAT)-like uncharacterized protein
VKITKGRARWIAVLASIALRLNGPTWRVRKIDGPPAKIDDKIFAFPHGHLLLPTYIYRHFGTVVVISRHRDGELIAEVARRFGHESVRGSTTRGGVQAALQLLRDWGERAWVITPDGPRGPLDSVPPGIIHLASLSGRAIVPMGFAASPAKRLSTWDRFTVPAPFARIVSVFGAALEVPPDVDRERADELATDLRERIRTNRERAEQELASW